MIAQNMLELIGETPLLRLNRVSHDCGAEVIVKLENRNPSGSVKDRAALGMLLDAEATGKLNQDTLLVEPTSGNTGIGLAFICAVKGWKLILTMPESMSIERRKVLQGFGAQLVLTPAADGMDGALREAERLVNTNTNALLVGQFTNPANPEIHRRTTAEEIWKATEHRVDAFVAGVGSSGTLVGAGGRLKELNPHLHVVAVEPAESPLLSEGKAAPHGIQGIGANFIPSLYNPHIADEIYTIPTTAALAMARRLIAEEGILCGISSGANVVAALAVASRPEMVGKRVVTIICDTGERYLSTALFDDTI